MEGCFVAPGGVEPSFRKVCLRACQNPIKPVGLGCFKHYVFWTQNSEAGLLLWLMIAVGLRAARRSACSVILQTLTARTRRRSSLVLWRRSLQLSVVTVTVPMQGRPATTVQCQGLPGTGVTAGHPVLLQPTTNQNHHRYMEPACLPLSLHVRHSLTHMSDVCLTVPFSRTTLR